jgi:hypothetical protein
MDLQWPVQCESCTLFLQLRRPIPVVDVIFSSETLTSSTKGQQRAASCDGLVANALETAEGGWGSRWVLRALLGASVCGVPT